MDRAAATLARAWFRAWRGWWWASGLSLAAILVLVLGTAGLLSGMEEATESRVADFYTGDLRITVNDKGAAPATWFDETGPEGLEAARTALASASGGAVEPRLETTFALSRRGLAEAFLFEDEQYGLMLPGSAADHDAYSVGVIAGLTLADPATRDRLLPYLVAGTLPSADHQGDHIPLLMSRAQFRSLLDPAERDLMGPNPSAGQMASVGIEITAARIDDSSGQKDIIRYPGRVMGLYESGLDALDRITIVAPIEDVRRLLGADPDEPVANALAVHGGDASAAAAYGRGHGWESEGADRFTQRYMGQLVAVIQTLGLSLSWLLLVFPFFMVWTGMSQQLDRSRRELAVCRAIGLHRATVRRALLALSGRVAAIALVPASVLLVLLAVFLPGLLGPGIDFPFPLGFAIPLWVTLATAACLVVAGTIALAGALRRHGLADLASALRSA